MKADEVKALSDSELVLFIETAQEEKRTRDERRRQETIARIKELAAAEGIPIHIDGVRGRPSKPRTPVNDSQRPKLPVNDSFPAEKATKSGR